MVGLVVRGMVWWGHKVLQVVLWLRGAGVLAQELGWRVVWQPLGGMVWTVWRVLSLGVVGLVVQGMVSWGHSVLRVAL